MRATWGSVQLNCQIWALRAGSHTHLCSPPPNSPTTHTSAPGTVNSTDSTEQGWEKHCPRESQRCSHCSSINILATGCCAQDTKRRDQDTVTACWGLTVRWETYSSKLPISIWSHKLNWGERRVLWECSRPPEWRSGMTSWRNGTLGELKVCNNEPEEG